jgi:hypothetical protein
MRLALERGHEQGRREEHERQPRIAESMRGHRWMARSFMARVDFGHWNPPSDTRAEIERVATRLPADWRVTLGLGSVEGRAPSPVFVQDAAGKCVAQSACSSDRFGSVASFLERVLRHHRWLAEAKAPAPEQEL